MEMVHLFVIVLVGVVLPLGVALIVTSAPDGVTVYRAVPSGPDDVEGSERIAPGIYRGHMRTRSTLVAENVPLAELPSVVRSTASDLRIVVCLGMLALLPTLAVVIFGVWKAWPNISSCFGLPGIALTFGQMVARKQLLLARPKSGKIARLVGYWTIVHSVLALGFCGFAAVAAVISPYASALVAGYSAALLAGWELRCAWIAIRMIAAATALERWQQARNVL